MTLATAAVVAALLLLVLVLVLAVVLAGSRRALKAARQRAEREAFLTGFESETLYTLLGIGRVEVDGERRYFGAVRMEDGSVRPFMTAADASALAPGNLFSSVRGRLVRLEGEQVAAAEPVTRISPPRAPPAAPRPPAPVVNPTVTVTGAPAWPPAPAATAPAPEPEPEPEDDVNRTRVFAKPPKSTAPDASFGLPFLELIEGPGKGRRFVVGFARARIGREPSNEVALADGSASRVHCELSYKDGRFLLCDNNSTNGTLRNGEAIQQVELELGDVIGVAGTELRFSCDGSELKDSEPRRAISALERCVQQGPDFLPALRMLAFLLERDVGRRREAEPLWRRVAELEQRR